MIARVALLLAFACAVLAQDCSFEDYDKNMQNYLAQLSNSFENVMKRVKKEKFAFVESVNANLTAAFKKAGCPDLWKGEEVKKEDRLMPIFEMMKTLDPVPPENVMEMMKHLEDSMWLLSQDHSLGSCVMSIVRDYGHEQLQKCAGKKIFPVDFENRKNVKMPDMTDKEFMANLRASINRMTFAIMLAHHCAEGKEAVDKALNEVFKANDKDYCFSASDSFDTDACYDKFTGNCPKFIACSNEQFGKDLQKRATEMFVKSTDRFKKCLASNKKFWESKGGRPDGVPSAAKMMTRAVKIMTAISQMKFSEEDFVKGQNYFAALTMAIIRPHSCNCDLPEPPADEE